MERVKATLNYSVVNCIMRLYFSRLNFWAVFCLGLSFLVSSISMFSLMLYKELFAILGLILFLTDIAQHKTIYISKSVYVLIALCSIPIIQGMVGIIYFRQDVFFACAYLMIFASSLLVGLNINQKVITQFVCVLAIVGIISSLMSINQIFIHVQNSFLLEAAYGGRATANIGQPNQLGTLLIISLCALFYLNLKYSLNKVLLFSCIFLMIVAIYLTQSRTAWLSFFAISFLYLIKYHTKHDLLKVFGLNILFIVIAWSIPRIQGLFSHDIAQSAVERAQSGSTRFKIWPQLIESAVNKPFLGHGWGQVDVAQMQTANALSTKGEWFTYSHNLFLDLMVWNGLILGILFSFIILFAMSYKYLKVKTKENLFLYFMVFAFFVHCMLEYPFAYSYFLITAGIVYGYLSRSIQMTESKPC